MSKVKAVRKTIVRPTSDSEETTSSSSRSINDNETFALTAQNYKLIAVGIVILIVGYLLLSIEKFIDATHFSIALHVAPFVIVAGYVEIIYAILHRPKKEIGTTHHSNREELVD